MNRNEEFDNFTNIGGGAFSRVYRAMHRLDGKSYALKVIRDISSPKSLKHAKIEVDVLAQLDHPNIVRYFGCWVERTCATRVAVRYPVGCLPLSCSNPSEATHSNESTSAAACSWASNVSTGDGNCRLLHLVDEDDSGEDLHDATEPSEGGDSCALALPESRIVHFSVNELNACPVTLVIQMELCGSTLSDWVQIRNNSLCSPTASDCPKHQSFDHSYRAQVRWIFDQIAKGLHYMHQKGVLHRDIKPANVFIQGPHPAIIIGSTCQAAGELVCTSVECFHRCHVKIGDFGLSTFLERPPDNRVEATIKNKGSISAQTVLTEPTRPVIEELTLKDEPGPSTALQTTSSFEPRLLTGNLGTLFYTAPEVLKSNSKGRSLYNHKADVYSLGVVLFQMLYPCKTEAEMAYQIDHFHVNPETDDALPKSLVDCWPLEASLLRRMLRPRPSDRPEAIEILSELAPSSQIIDGIGLKNCQDTKDEPTLINKLKKQNMQLEQENADLKRKLGLPKGYRQ
ncbi:unnamed protein product [Hydatigera taeniaeformis]|uniref:non-specific serine/threonine protein kinase n=1 Tax=Hydatigena taeniaeformis TaxID=6205 RepID=A0A158RE48_HYDTA|nr:unnamed protein product [Hydatigera taeniaeformis]